MCGSPYLPTDGLIKVKFTASTLPDPEACFSTIKLPLSNSDYRSFETSMNIAVNCQHTGYGRGQTKTYDQTEYQYHVITNSIAYSELQHCVTLHGSLILSIFPFFFEIVIVKFISVSVAFWSADKSRKRQATLFYKCS